MREEMLKRLDEIIADGIRHSGGHVPAGWVAFHCDLVEERCENCTHWRFADVGSAALCMKSGSYLYQVATVFHYYCPHFEKKEPSAKRAEALAKLAALPAFEETLLATTVAPENHGAAHWLGEILAIVHCDGGQYRHRHGDGRATRDAIDVICRERAVIDEREFEAVQNIGRALVAAWKERDRARTLIKLALQKGKMHGEEYAWEALVAGADAALADESPEVTP